MNKKNIDIIIRGFVYRPNWVPLSTRRRWFRNYTIDFLNCSEQYKILIDKLKNKYNINLYFTTYDTTPIEYIENIKEKFMPKQIFISKEYKSSQFTTTATALRSEEIKSSENFLLLIRSDLYMSDKFINIISDFNYNDDILYVLCKEKNKRDRVIDVLHGFSQSVKEKFYRYISIPNLKHAHKIHKNIFTLSLSVDHSCKSTDLCREFYSVYPNKEII